jgi:hypothetical protein
MRGREVNAGIFLTLNIYIMRLLDLFKEDEEQATVHKNGIEKRETPVLTKDRAAILPRPVIREEAPQPVTETSNKEITGIELIYNFLQDDYETRGYNDALINPDDRNRADGIKLIKLDFKILIERVINFYDCKLRDIDFHINSRSRLGLVDLVEQLKAEKSKVLAEMDRVKNIETKLESGTGLTERIILSYQKGFMKGLADSTQSKFLK